MTSLWSSSADHTVVLLGAGASSGSEKNLPAMQGFFGPTMASMSAELIECLRWFYGHEDLTLYNVEDVLSYVDLARARIPKWTGIGSEISYAIRRFTNWNDTAPPQEARRNV